MHRPSTKLLIVDDNEVDVEVVRRALRRLGLDSPLLWARNGEEALELLRRPDAASLLAPPLVLMVDINMPRMNGFELLDEIARDGIFDDVPVFVLSTSNNPQDRRVAQSHGVRGYLVKPITGPLLLDVLGSAVAVDRVGPATDRR